MEETADRAPRSGHTSGQGFAKCVVMPNWDDIDGILGETVREIGTLVFVFAPLESAFAEGPVNAVLLTVAVCGSVVTIIAGILLEAKDQH